MVTIYLENNELDINEGFSQQITYAVDDLQNLDSKSTAFSKTIVIPGTANNNKLFGNIFEFTNSNFTGDGPNVGYNFNASKAAKVRLEINGLTAIKGVLRLLTIIHDGENIEYEVAIFGELGGFVNALGNKKLEDLDFSAYNHNYTIANIQNSWSGNLQLVTSGNFYNNDRVLIDVTEYQRFYIGDIITISGTASNNGNYTIKNVINDAYTIIIGTPITFKTQLLIFNESVQNGSDGNFTITYPKKGRSYFYPLIDYGLVSTNKKDYKYSAFRPSLYVREYIDKIIKGAGYTYESNFFDSGFFNRLIVPHNLKELYNKSTTFYVQNTSSDLLTYYNSNVGVLTFGYPTFNGLTLNNFSYFDGVPGLADPYFRYQGTIPIYAKVKVTFSYTAIITNGGSANASIMNAGQRLQTIELIADGIKRRTTIELLLNIFNQDIIKFSVWGIPSSGSAVTIYLDNDTLIEIISEPENFIPYQLNDSLNVNHFLPVNVFQKDFFTSILKMFYLMVTEDKDRNNHLIIEPWVEFYNLDRTSYLDWSDKIDRSQPIKIVPMSEINARYYNINYKPDSDYFNEDYKKKFNEGYGNVVFDNQLDFAKDSSTTEVIFSATPLVGYQDEDKVVSTIFKWDGTTTDKEERVSSNIRILQSKLIEDVESWTIKNDSGTTIATNTNYPYAGHLDDPDIPGSDLSFGVPKELYFNLAAGALGNNLFNTYYSSYLSEITDKDSRLVIAKIKLNEQDIFNLDFSRFIWIDGVLYRLSKIIDYSAGEICTIELLRVIYTTYQTGSPAQTECILTEDSICLQTEGGDNITIEN
jgi:hypothetical protein